MQEYIVQTIYKEKEPILDTKNKPSTIKKAHLQEETNQRILTLFYYKQIQYNYINLKV